MVADLVGHPEGEVAILALLGQPSHPRIGLHVPRNHRGRPDAFVAILIDRKRLVDRVEKFLRRIQFIASNQRQNRLSGCDVFTLEIAIGRKRRDEAASGVL